MTISFEQTILAHPGVTRVREALIASGLADTIIAMPAATHTAQAAADALGCTVGEIAKSIIFRLAGDTAALVITSGKNRVDEKKVVAQLSEKLAKADADFVRERTGFVIGGVAPIAHRAPSRVLMDEDLMQYDAVFPAAGHPNTMFRIAQQALAALAGATIANIRSEK
jgi:prolyl-tRNA editing enzyme YbaK/EbsC (Cys-tRNA(Pro) deacylase)